MFLTFETVGEILKCAIQLKPVCVNVLFVMMNKVVLTLESMGEDHSTDSC